ncbi:hypothetical protein PIB30_033063 [Stylosanthes scabra]|uniref:Uncharacterized protein n=1 Tax=Stylosanthes scabra TaxID=79078 RepID=A0ABU6ZA33_9FABA|nr:hypothetical protein [Stylosanthes scabra]
MALPSTFQERLHHMDRTRCQRLSLLQAEKDLQANKSRVLSSKLSNIRATEQRCFFLDHKIASQNFNLLSLTSQIHNLEAKYHSLSQLFRSLRNEVDELEELREKRDRFYEAKMVEMKQFKKVANEFVVRCRMDVQILRNRVNELNSSFIELKGNSPNSCNSEIAAAERRRLELEAEKECVYRNLASNQHIKAQLQKQLQNILMTQTQDKRK